MTESRVQTDIRLAAAYMGIELYRNNTGVLKNEDGVPIRYGLCNDSSKLNKKIKSSDLIGIVPETAYIDGKGFVKIGIFLAVECKEEGWKFNPNNEREVAQKAFHDIVRAAGGYAGFATSVEEFKRIIGK